MLSLPLIRDAPTPLLSGGILRRSATPAALNDDPKVVSTHSGFPLQFLAAVGAVSTAHVSFMILRNVRSILRQSGLDPLEEPTPAPHTFLRCERTDNECRGRAAGSQSGLGVTSCTAHQQRWVCNVIDVQRVTNVAWAGPASSALGPFAYSILNIPFPSISRSPRTTGHGRASPNVLWGR